MKKEKLYSTIIISAISLTSIMILAGYLPAWWKDVIETITQIITLVVALKIAYDEREKSRFNNLPKKLDVILYYKNEIVHSIRNSDLISEGDIRQWAQSLSKMAVGNLDYKNLSINRRGEVKIGGGSINKYEVIFHLESLPQGLQ